MTALLSLFTGSLTVPFAGAVIAAIVLAGGGFYGYERIQIASLNHTITADDKTIADVRAQLAASVADLAIANQGIKTLGDGLASEKAQIDTLHASQAAATQRASQAAAQAADNLAKASSLAQVLAAQKPVAPSYEALAGLIRKPVQ